MSALGVVALDQVFLASAATTGERISSDFTNVSGHNGLVLYFNCTAAPAVPTGVLNVVLEAKDPATGNYVQLTPDYTSTTAVSATGTKTYYFGTGALSQAAKFAGTANTPLPRIFRLRVKNAASESYTFSIGGTLVQA